VKRLEVGLVNISQSDIDGFENEALQHLDAVYRAAMALCRERQEAEDLVQTTYLKAMERFGTFKKGTDGKAWLLQILRNTWIDRLRHQRVIGTAVRIEDIQLAERPAAEEPVWSNACDLLENFSDEQVINALQELPDEQRLTLFLVDVERLSLRDVAEITGVAVGTVKSRSARARSQLKWKLATYAKELGLTGR
jgi:RNA polymerase sigma-70 factor (ECF subfamily)